MINVEEFFNWFDEFEIDDKYIEKIHTNERFDEGKNPLQMNTRELFKVCGSMFKHTGVKEGIALGDDIKEFTNRIWEKELNKKAALYVMILFRLALININFDEFNEKELNRINEFFQEMKSKIVKYTLQL